MAMRVLGVSQNLRQLSKGVNLLKVNSQEYPKFVEKITAHTVVIVCYYGRKTLTLRNGKMRRLAMNGTNLY